MVSIIIPLINLKAKVNINNQFSKKINIFVALSYWQIKINHE
jgi:hypothetical protein